MTAAVEARGRWGIANGIVLAVLASGVAAAALAWRVWPFYRHLLVGHDAGQPSDGRARFDALDGLRGILCLLVVVHHAAITLALVDGRGLAEWGAASERVAARAPALQAGPLAVALFFATTGFLFYARVVERRRPLEVGRFLVQRAARIAPALFISLGAILVCSILFRQMPSHSLLARIVARAVSLGALGPSGIEQNASVLWTLSYEWAFYLTFPLLAAAVSAGVPAWARVLAAFGATGLATADQINAGALVPSSPCFMFIAGIAAVHLMDRPAIRRLASGLGGPAVLAATWLFAPSLSPWRLFGPIGLAVVLVAFTTIVAGCDAFGLMRLPALRAVGAASYSVYLLHGIAIFFARPLLFKCADRPVAAWAIVCGVTALTVWVSLAAFRWVERPGIEWGRRITTPKRDDARP